ncbi:DUF4153 domain-containing protein [Lysobacter sp. K5869]|uniref:DUF4153 domain-containing protein n=1 Tax=Lysobacter sp. K5869 TaxID=2820808 RepID=UPI001C060AE7|nr:DUF4153 domain-containing protein [Lysobacter sp. K5869]QWP76531.1 DUF4153 domain-containing protein [Lysobacter sp. K5869]
MTSHTAPAPAELSGKTRAFIVLIALLQGLLLYLARIDSRFGFELEIAWYALTLSVPTAMLLTVQRLDDARYWTNIALVAAVCLPLSIWAGWSAAGAPDLDEASVLAPFAASLAIGLFVALPYLQCRLHHGRWCAPYRELFEHGWQNALTLILTAAFVGICWAVLGLCAVLFKLIGIEFFADVFSTRSFVHLASGVMIGLGVLVGRTQQRPVQIARQILFAIFKGLLPLVALIALLFVASLPFTGLDALWSTRSATQILTCLIATVVLFVNAVYQDGEAAPPYPRWLRWVVNAALLTLPVYAALSLYALSLRIGQYGWTGERFWAALAATTMGLYALGYAIAALRRGDGWLGGLRRVNVAVSLVLLALVVAANSWLLDPHRLGAGSQLAQLRSGKTEADKFDLAYLRFDAGRRGYQALQSLKADPRFAASAPKARANLERALAATRSWEYRSELSEPPQSKTRGQTLRKLQRADGLAAIDPAWIEAALADRLRLPNCQDENANCVLASPDLDNDGHAEYLLCRIDEWGVNCNAYALLPRGWRDIGQSYLSQRGSEAEAVLRANKVEVVPRRWGDIRVGAGNDAVRLERPARRYCKEGEQGEDCEPRVAKSAQR